MAGKVLTRLSRKTKPAAGGGRRDFNFPLMFLLVFEAQIMFGMWMNYRGFVLVDAMSRAMNSLQVLYSTDPHAGSIGFVWMPLPSLMELLWVVFYPLFPGIVSSGFASTVTTALAGGATATLLLATARALDLPRALSWAYALLVSTNPMLFLYASNGMSEGVAAPFLTGAVCCLILFWRSGRRRHVVLASLALALGFASLYEAMPYGAALFTALVLGLLRGSESKESAPQGRWRAVEGLGILFLVPSLYVAILWISANAIIMDDPLYFARSQYGNAAQTVKDTFNAASGVAGDVPGSLWYIAERAAPFLIPVAPLLLVRALDGRLFRANTFSLLLLALIVQVSLITPLIYLGSSFGWLRFFMYPLFVAAGWGLHEMAQSKHRTRAAALVLSGWVLAAPVIFWTMTQPELGQEEHFVANSLLSGKHAEQAGYFGPHNQAPVADYLNQLVFPKKQTVILDSFHGSMLASQVLPSYFHEQLILTADRRFEDAVRDPEEYGVSYFLVPSPDKVVAPDAIILEYPGLWAGDEPGFELVSSFPETYQDWRLYETVPPGTGELERNDLLTEDLSGNPNEERASKADP